MDQSLAMALPQEIPVRYTEEEAGYISFRPVVRQTFRLNELLDMVLSVTGKHSARIRQILRSGAVVFHFYRYWWQGFDIEEDELQSLLANFPDSEPWRPFRGNTCSAVLIESSGSPPRSSLELKRADAARKRLLRRRSFWDALLAEAVSNLPAYDVYSYIHHADLYRLDLTPDSRARLADAASRAPRSLRRELETIHQAARAVFVCPRPEASRPGDRVSF